MIGLCSEQGRKTAQKRGALHDENAALFQAILKLNAFFCLPRCERQSSKATCPEFASWTSAECPKNWASRRV
jgi:hypothetical protein